MPQRRKSTAERNAEFYNPGILSRERRNQYIQYKTNVMLMTELVNTTKYAQFKKSTITKTSKL